MTKIKLYLFVFIFGCVLALAVRSYFTEKKLDKCKDELIELKSENKRLLDTIIEQSKQIQDLQKDNERLIRKAKRR